MRASIRAALVAGLGLMTACGGDGTGPGAVGTVKGNGQPATMTGEVLTIRFQPDSTYVPVGDVTIRVYYLGALPEDSLGIPPNDSSLVDPVPIDPWGMSDSLPGDTTSWPPPPPPVDTFPPPVDTLFPPVDTLPPDTNPPPPPLGQCGGRGELVATVSTNPQGKFTLPNLDAGRYDLVAEAPEGYRFDGLACDVAARGGQPTTVRLFLAPPPSP